MLRAFNQITAQVFVILLSLAVPSAGLPWKKTSRDTAITLTQYEDANCSQLDYTLELDATPDFSSCTRFQFQGHSAEYYMDIICDQSTGEVDIMIRTDADCQHAVGDGVRFDVANYNKLIDGHCASFSSQTPDAAGFSYKLSGATLPQCDTFTTPNPTPIQALPAPTPAPRRSPTPPNPVAPPTPMPVVSPSAFLLNNHGLNACPSWYKNVHSMMLCEQARHALGGGALITEQHDDERPSGCYQYKGLWYLNSAAGNGSSHCRQACIATVPVPVLPPSSSRTISPAPSIMQIKSCPDALLVRNLTAVRRNRAYMGVYTKIPDPPPHPFQQAYTIGKNGKVPIYWKNETDGKSAAYNTLFYWPTLDKWVFGDKQSFAGVGLDLNCPTDEGSWNEWVPSKDVEEDASLTDDWGVGDWVWNDFKDGSWEHVSLEITDANTKLTPRLTPSLRPPKPTPSGEPTLTSTTSTQVPSHTSVATPTLASAEKLQERIGRHLLHSASEGPEQSGGEYSGRTAFLQICEDLLASLRWSHYFNSSLSDRFRAPMRKRLARDSPDLLEDCRPVLLFAGLICLAFLLCGVICVSCLLNKPTDDGTNNCCAEDALRNNATSCAVQKAHRHKPARPLGNEGRRGDTDYRQYDFCPKLLVPDCSTDYVLYVPIRLDGEGPFDVVDSDGKRVVRIAPRGPSACQSPHVRNALNALTPTGGHARAVNWWRLLLLEPSDDSVIAQCCTMGTNEFHLRRADGSFFAKLVHDIQNDNCYSLAVFDGLRYVFKGDRTKQVYRIEDDTGTLLATAERWGPWTHGAFYSLRVTASIEVGLALCGILCVEWHGLVRHLMR